MRSASFDKLCAYKKAPLSFGISSGREMKKREETTKTVSSKRYNVNTFDGVSDLEQCAIGCIIDSELND